MRQGERAGMTESREPKASRGGGAAGRDSGDRADRLAKKLRENLGRRKAQQRGRDSAGESGEDAGSGGGNGKVDPPTGGDRRKSGDPGP